jgi:hypothetical protein
LDITRNPIVKGWIARERTQQEGDILFSLYESSFLLIYRYFSTTLTAKMEILECMIVSQVRASHLDLFILNFKLAMFDICAI